MTLRTVGIDPGSKGAIALLDTQSQMIKTWNIPISREAHKTVTKNVVDAVKFVEIIREIGVEDCTFYLEDVFSMASDGHVGAFTFGMNKGALVALLTAIGADLRFIGPAKWKGDMGCTKDKNQTKKVARALFPDGVKALTNEGKHEAALIAMWGLLQQEDFKASKKYIFRASS